MEIDWWDGDPAAAGVIGDRPSTVREAAGAERIATGTARFI